MAGSTEWLAAWGMDKSSGHFLAGQKAPRRSPDFPFRDLFFVNSPTALGEASEQYANLQWRKKRRKTNYNHTHLSHTSRQSGGSPPESFDHTEVFPLFLRGTRSIDAQRIKRLFIAPKLQVTCQV